MSEEFFAALKSGDQQKVSQLLAADPRLAEAEERGTSAVMTALYHGRRDLARQIAASKPSLSTHEAAALGDDEALRRALDEDPASLDRYSGDGFTPLTFAAFFGQASTLELLLQRGADATLPSRGGLKTSPLLAALAGPNPSLALPLIKAGADVHARGDSGFTPLHSAAHHNQPEVVQALLDAGADPSATTDDGKTALDYAEAKGNAAVAELLRAGQQR